MTRIIPAMLSIFLCLTVLPLPLSAGGKSDYQASVKRYLQTAEEYRAKSRELAATEENLAPRQKGYVKQLSDTYGQLADIKIALAVAVGNRDWPGEERLETQYYLLKDREKALWDALDVSKN